MINHTRGWFLTNLIWQIILVKIQNQTINTGVQVVFGWCSGGPRAVVRQRSDEGVQTAAEQFALQRLIGRTHGILHDQLHVQLRHTQTHAMI